MSKSLAISLDAAASLPCAVQEPAAKAVVAVSEESDAALEDVIPLNPIECRKGTYGASFLRKALREMQQVRVLSWHHGTSR